MQYSAQDAEMEQAGFRVWLGNEQEISMDGEKYV
jgi:hypothetical protein